MEEGAALKPMILTCPGCIELPEQGIRVLCTPAESCLAEKDCFTVMSRGTICLRARLPGDTMRLSGGTKELLKLFIDKKIPAALRSGIPVLADDLGVLGVYGLGPNRDRLARTLPGVQIRFESVLSSGTL